MTPDQSKILDLVHALACAQTALSAVDAGPDNFDTGLVKWALKEIDRVFSGAEAELVNKKKDLGDWA